MQKSLLNLKSNLQVLVRIGLCLMSITLWTKESQGDSPVCRVDEVTVFQCETSKSKIITVCTTKGFNKTNGHITYRFGTKDKTEIEFPADKSRDHFTYGSFFRSQVDRFHLNFSNSDYDYFVFDDTENGHATRGVTTTNKVSSKETTIICKKNVVSKLGTLKDLVKCDTDDALNLGGCK